MFIFFLVVVVVVVPQDTFWSELHESIEAVWLIDNPVKLENDVISLFGQLRMCVAEAFDSESESVPAVFHF